MTAVATVTIATTDLIRSLISPIFPVFFFSPLFFLIAESRLR